MPWQPPSLSVRWGAYQKPDAEEQTKTVQAVEGALGANKGVKIITTRLALEKLKQAGVLEIDNVEAVLAELEKEQTDADNKAREDAKNQLADAAAVEVQTQKRLAGSGGAQPKGAPA
jgi:hypothetical protein